MRALLMYHSIDPSGSAVSVDASEFRLHVRWLAGGPLPVRGVPELLAPDGPTEALALTFDDALASFGTIAWPLLRDHGLPVTLFVPTTHVGGSTRWNPERLGLPTLPLMSWDAIARAAAEGVVLGAHTRTHPDLRTLSGAALEDEILGGAALIEERTGARVTSFAYPFGRFDAAALSVVRRRFDWACTTELRALRAREDRHLLPRVDAFYLRRPGRLPRLGSPRFRAELGLRRTVRSVRDVVTRRAV